MADNTLQVADIVSEYGAYYIPGSANEKQLISLQKQQTKTPSYATPIVSDATVYRAPQTYMSEVIQPFQSKFTDKGQLTVKPNDIPTYKMKIDTGFYPDELEETYLGFLTKVAEADRAKWPFVKWFLEVHILEQKKHDLETQAYGKGVYVAPTPGTAGAASTCMNGLVKLIDDGIAGTVTPHSLMNPVVLSAAVSSSNAFDMIEEFVDNFDTEIEDEPIIIGLEPSLLKWYLRDKRNTHGADTNYTENKAYKVDFMDNVELAPMPSLKGTGIIFGTTKKNFVHITPKKKMNPIRIEGAKREVSVMGDWREGLGFLFNELVYAYKPV
ncbi:hypothetical protein [Tenacibaculum sp. 47A_GOM-205m]|uniref:hypothetical protein n=1 Tax=Tenacibaculum sp. 47A_GOM-205m TaxID=1380384 RepID=UPI000491EDFB|nr:hypothetical protein [Tenacibaculum sp. 47A_GOM-205m]